MNFFLITFPPIAKADFNKLKPIIVSKPLHCAIDHHSEQNFLLNANHFNDSFDVRSRPQVPFVIRCFRKILRKQSAFNPSSPIPHRRSLLTLIPAEPATIIPSLYNSIFVFPLPSAVPSPISRLLMSIIFFDIGNIFEQ